MEQEKNADIIWIKIEEALKDEGCPICSIMERSVDHYLENLLYEYVLDVGVRKKLHASVGFCTAHGYKLLKIMKRLNDDGLKIALLYETVLSDEINKLELMGEKCEFKFKGNFFNKFLGRSGVVEILKLIDKLNPSGECPACFQERSVESLYVDEFCVRSKNDEFKNLFKADRVILCRYHFIEILRECAKNEDKNAFLFFMEMQILKLKKLLADMVRFIDKHDYRQRGSFDDDELKSWKLAFEYFSGKEGILRAWANVRQFNTKL